MNYFYIDYMIKEQRKQELEALEQARLFRNHNTSYNAEEKPVVHRVLKRLIKRVKRIVNQKQTVVELELPSKRESCSLT